MRSCAQDHRARKLQTEARKDPLPSSCFAFCPTRLGWERGVGTQAGKRLGVSWRMALGLHPALILSTFCCFCPVNCVWLELRAGFPGSQSHRGLICHPRCQLPRRRPVRARQTASSSPCRRALSLQASGPGRAGPSFSSLVCGLSCADNPVHRGSSL